MGASLLALAKSIYYISSFSYFFQRLFYLFIYFYFLN